MTARLIKATYLDRVPASVRRFLDHDKLWVMVFFVGMIAAFALSINAARTANRSAAARDASVTASADATYRSCIASRPILKKFQTHVKGVNDLVVTLVQNSAASAAAAAPGTRDYRTKSANLVRLLTAEAEIAAFSGIVVPSVQDCADRRDAILGIPRPPSTQVPQGQIFRPPPTRQP